jgi:hypothetical protein
MTDGEGGATKARGGLGTIRRRKMIISRRMCMDDWTGGGSSSEMRHGNSSVDEKRAI